MPDTNFDSTAAVWKNKRTIIVVCFLIVGAISGVGLTTGQSQPGEPQSFFGTIEETDGTPAPEGVELFAIIDGEVEDSITVSPSGEYGGESTFDERLTVNSGAGNEVEFRVFSPTGPQALQSPFDLADAESEPQNLALTFPDGTFETEGSASFAIDITNAPEQVTENDDLTVSYTVENTGSADGTQTLEFTIDGTTIDTQEVTLTSGETVSESFTYTTGSDDTPDVTVGIASENDRDTSTVAVQSQSGEDRRLESLSIALGATAIEQGETTEATVTAEFDDGTSDVVTESATIESANADIATIDGATITAQSEGEVEISAEYTDGDISETDTTQLTVQNQSGENRELDSLSLSLGATTITEGETTEATVTAEFSDGTSDTVTESATIESANADVATIDGATITAQNEGDVEISAEITDSDISETDTTQLTVESPRDDSNNDDDTNSSLPRELTVNETEQRFNIPDNQTPERAEAAAIQMNDGSSTAMFTNESIIESLTVDAEAVEEVAIAEYDESLPTVPSVPGTTLRIVDIQVPEQHQQASGTIVGRIPSTLLNSANIDTGDLQIQRLANEEWQGLETEELSQTEQSVRVRTETSAFSFFAISAVSDPTATFNVGQQPRVGDEITLNASESTDKYGEIVGYEWRITPTNGEEQTLTGEQVTTTFDSSGEYEISLTVENDAGRTAVLNQTTTVEQAEPVLTGISIELNPTTISEGESASITVLAEFADSSTEDVTDEATITTESTDIVSVSGSTLTGATAGGAEISAEYDGEAATQTIVVEEASDSNDGNNAGDDDNAGEDDDTADESGPGFGLVAALLAILTTAYAARRRVS